MQQLKGQVVWITGASSGIGEAMALQAAQAGAQVVISARRKEELERVKAAAAQPAQIHVLPLDLTQLDAEKALQAASKPFGRITVLVNNAGISQRSTVLDTDMQVYRRILELDFFACVALTKAVLPGMVQAGQGSILTISSVVGYVGTPLRSGYAAAKHALHGFFDAARSELWKDGIHIMLACPGFVKTAVSLNAITGDGGRHGLMDTGQATGMSAEDCARRIWAAWAAREDEVIVGKERAFVWLRRFLPGVTRALVHRAKAV